MTMTENKPKHDKGRSDPSAKNYAKVKVTGEREFECERILNATRDKVWRAYTEPKLLAQWWGRGNELVVETFELKKGGHWRFVEHAEGQEHGFEGRFREIRPQDLIEMTFEWDGMPGHSLVDTYTFHDLGDGRTRLHAKSMAFTKQVMDGMLGSGMEGGMNESFDALDRLLATM
jgi:uncharacterized protein YndB with AHSA1/START domain